MRKLTSLFVAATLAVGATGIAHAAADHLTPAPADQAKSSVQHKMHNHKGHHHFHHHGGMWGMYKGLNLTDAQKQQMRDILKESHKGMKRPSLDERRAMHAIVAADKFDQSKAEAQATKITANSKEHVVKMLETQNKLYNVLTAEQKKQYNDKFEQRLTKKSHHHQGKMLQKEAKTADKAE